ncbi:MAG: RluA family pseudouridine synthase [Deltaproteobacteria bacterium]|jgi:23S rRNA pseudouridine1911/1915/1917 synthase|nr:RluA family pseudouridine synthase [Deltaproteobacteria bacterium]
MTEPRQSLPVREEDRGQRLDRFLAEHLRLSRSQVRRLLARGAVSVGGRSVNEDAKGLNLQPGPVIEVTPFARPEDQRALPASDQPLELLARGSGWLAVDKPAGTPVHPLREEETDTVLNALIGRFPEIHAVGEGGLRSGVVHRLDVDTSGVLLFATEEQAWQRLRGAFREHLVEKVYRALVIGELEGEGSLEVGLVTARHRPARVRVVAAEELARARGVHIGVLRWRSLEVFGGATLVEVRPRTGFLHQIRVSLAHLGFPVLGDRTYGPASDPIAVPRQMLHAAHARWGEIEASSPDPADFEAALAACAGLSRGA